MKPSVTVNYSTFWRSPEHHKIRWLKRIWQARKVRNYMSLLGDLFSTIDRRSLSGIASSLGASEESIPRGVESALATVMGGMAGHSDDPNLLRRSLDLMPSGKGDLSW